MRIWYSNYRNLQYWLSSNHVLIIIQSYDVHHVHESQSDGMDHQWFRNTILMDIIKMTFLYILIIFIIIILIPDIFFGVGTQLPISYEKKTWFLFILMLSDRNKMGFKYQPGNMQYWLSSNHVLIIIPSSDVHHVHESQSDGMDHQ